MLHKLRSLMCVSVLRIVVKKSQLTGLLTVNPQKAVAFKATHGSVPTHELVIAPEGAMAVASLSWPIRHNSRWYTWATCRQELFLRSRQRFYTIAINSVLRLASCFFLCFVVTLLQMLRTYLLLQFTYLITASLTYILLN